MIDHEKCLLCKGDVIFFYKYVSKDILYYKCSNCNSIMMDPLNYLSSKDEKSRYLTHNNDVEDPRYQDFVSPIVKGVKLNYDESHIGLDYGAGTGPVITSLLEKEDYNVKLFDPYFHPYPENLLKKYDYIICSEVIEHFYEPYKEFQKLTNILNPGGCIFCMTSIYDESINFEKWNYKEDETHVFFYHKNALKWIKKEFGFSELKIDGDLIKFIK